VENIIKLTKQNIQNPFARSLILHFLVILSLTTSAYIWHDDVIDYQAAIRVDIVGLPEKLESLPEPSEDPKKEELAEEPPPSQPKPVPEKAKIKAPEKKISLKKEQHKALEKLQAMEALEKIETEVASKKVKRKKLVAGNLLSKGSALKGIQNNQAANYISTIEEHIKNHWQLPQWMKDAQLRARAVVFINSEGRVTKRYISESSGNKNYDDLVLQSIDDASPFPPPPSSIAGLFKAKGFTLGFPD